MAYPSTPMPAPYWPFVQHPETLSMGLARLALEDWIEPDERYGEELARKHALLNERPEDVFAELPGSRPAQTELRDLLKQYLPARYPERFERSGSDIRQREARTEPIDPDLPPLLQASLWVQDDLCLLEESGGLYRLTAASLCAPSYWRLSEKIGEPLGAIHGPVPAYDTELNPRVSRFFNHLKVEQPVWRGNWSVVADPELFQPGDELRDLASAASITEQDAGDRLYTRIERQTLRRLPRSKAIAFTIRVYIHPLSEVAANQQLAGHLLQALHGMEEAEWRYKAMHPFRSALLAYLENLCRVNR